MCVCKNSDQIPIRLCCWKQGLCQSLMIKPASMSSDSAARNWVVLGAAFTSNVLNGGFLQIMGVYMVAWQDYFAVDATAIASVASLMSLVARLSGIVSGALCKRFGCRFALMLSALISFLSTFLGSFVQTLWQLHIYAFFAGFGYGLAYTPSFIAVSSRFKTRLGLANGIICAGVGVGIFAMAPIIEVLCDAYGWKGALLVHSGITAHRFALALLLKPSAAERKALREFRLERSESKRLYHRERTEVDGTNGIIQYGKVSPHDVEQCMLQETQKFNDKEVGEERIAYPHGCSATATGSEAKTVQHSKCMMFIRYIDRSFDLSYLACSPRYVIFLVSLIGTSMSTSQCRYYLLPKMVYDLNVPRIKASFGMTILGACMTLIRIFHGLILDSGLCSVTDLFLFGLAVAGTLMLVNPFVESFIGHMVLAGFWGVGDGLVLPLAALMTKEIVSQAKLANAVGIQYALCGVGLFVGIRIMGPMYDATGSYDVPFLLFGVVQWAAVLLLFYLTKCSKWKWTSGIDV